MKTKHECPSQELGHCFLFVGESFWVIVLVVFVGELSRADFIVSSLVCLACRE